MHANTVSADSAVPAPAVPVTDAITAVRLIKKYPNRRLYDTATSTYVTLADIKALILQGRSVVVRDARSDENLTRSILLQIILEEEGGGGPLFSEAALTALIRCYGHAMQSQMGLWLEKNMQMMQDMQNQWLHTMPALGAVAAPLSLGSMQEFWQQQTRHMLTLFTSSLALKNDQTPHDEQCHP